jgi:hypothetical protein
MSGTGRVDKEAKARAQAPDYRRAFQKIFA